MFLWLGIVFLKPGKGNCWEFRLPGEAGDIVDSKVPAGRRGHGFLPRIGLISNSFFPCCDTTPRANYFSMIRPSYQYRKNKLSFFLGGEGLVFPMNLDIS